MKIGIPKELKNNENRIAITPAGVIEFVKKGHEVVIQSNAGLGCGWEDKVFVEAGAAIVAEIEEVYAAADLIIKVKEPLPEEYGFIQPHHTLFTYFHFAASRELTEGMVARGAACIAYETVQSANGALPLLTPMSEVAGRMAIQEGAKYLEKPMGGKGKLLGGVPGVLPATVLVLGGGVVGTESARIAAGMGANVIVMDINPDRMRELEDILPKNVDTLYSNEWNIRSLLPEVDLVIGAVLIPGAKAPHLITRDMLQMMEKGTVLVDVAVDQGGCIETCKPTTHADPVYVVDDIVHYCVANMPGAVPQTSTYALTNSTLSYALFIAEHGWEKAANLRKDIRAGLNIVNGSVVNKAVSETFGLPYYALE